MRPKENSANVERVAVIGLGYVGLPVAVAFARKFPTVGFDISEKRVEALQGGIDITGQADGVELAAAGIKFTSTLNDITGSTLFIVTVPTPVDDDRQPDFGPLLAASESVASALKPGAVVCYESTVYPGATEQLCAPVLERASGLEVGADFGLAYSPERLNPGDPKHQFTNITKVVSAHDEATRQRVAAAYARVIDAEIYLAPSIQVAEAAKVIENVQRDLNIALMNELALIFDRIGLRTRDVLDAAETKWNFLRFSPGLVGGHCIGVDPYYLTTKAEKLGYHPQVILAGRRINDSIGAHVGQRTIKMLSTGGVSLSEARVAILGLAFKENVPDLRNTKVVDIIRELKDYGVHPYVFDPIVDAQQARRELGVELSQWRDVKDPFDALILAVPHRDYLESQPPEELTNLRQGGIVIDVKSVIEPASLRADLQYWSL